MTGKPSNPAAACLCRYDFFLASPLLGATRLEAEFDFGGTHVWVSSCVVQGLRCFFVEPANGYFAVGSVYGRADDALRFDFFNKARAAPGRPSRPTLVALMRCGRYGQPPIQPVQLIHDAPSGAGACCARLMHHISFRGMLVKPLDDHMPCGRACCWAGCIWCFPAFSMLSRSAASWMLCYK